MLEYNCTGIIKWYNFHKGYGFIESEDHNKDIFFHKSAIVDQNILNDSIGNTVTFEISMGYRGRVEARSISALKLDGMVTAEVINKYTDGNEQLEKGLLKTKYHELTPHKTKEMVHSLTADCNMVKGTITPATSDCKIQPTTIAHNNKIESTTANLPNIQEFNRLLKIDIIEPPPGAYFLFEETRKFYLLIDTGATRSILPNKQFSALKKCEQVLSGVTGNTLTTCGKISISLDFGLAIHFNHEFLVAELPFSYGILGNDFFSKHQMQICFASSTITHMPSKSFVEIQNTPCNSRALKKLSNKLEQQPIFQCIQSRAETPVSQAQTEEEKSCIAILNNFPDLLKEPSYLLPPKHNFKLDIELRNEKFTIYQKPRRVPATEFQAINENFRKLQQNGAVVKKSSNFASPVTVVKKKNGDHRICVDYRLLNAQTIDLNFPIPMISNLQFLLSKDHCYYSVLDLKSAYYSMPLTERASQRAAIITPSASYLPLRSPFGLKNSPAKFCELISSVIEGLESFTFAYLDDFIIFSKTFSDHKRHLQTLLTRLDSFGFFINSEKCTFAKQKVDFLGHQFSNNGIRPLQEKTDFISTIEVPKTLKELRSFLGIANYYRDHCKDFSKITSPLSKLLCGPKRPKKSAIPWAKEHQTAFFEAIQALKRADSLSHDEPNRPLVLTTDASETHAGGVLEQFTNELNDEVLCMTTNTPNHASNEQYTTRPLSYFSQAFPASTRVRSTFNRELSALYMAIRHFRFKLRGRRLIIRTDHRSLVRAIENPEGLHSPLERRMLYQIKEYMPKILFLPGNCNAVADHLSRPQDQKDENSEVSQSCSTTDLIAVVTSQPSNREEVLEPPHLSISTIAEVQSRSSLTQNILEEQISPGDKIIQKTITEDGIPYLIVGIEDEGHNYFRPYLPDELQPTAYHELHSVIHQGKKKSFEVIASRYFWPDMKSDIEKWTKACPECQKCKISRHTRQRLQSYPMNPRRLSTIHIDLMGPLPMSTNQSRYVLTMRDRGTGFLVGASLTDKTSFSVVSALRSHFIAPFGVPTTIVSDNGREFRSNEFSSFCAYLGINHKFTMAYHPQCNGIVERVHRTIRVAFRALDDSNSWADVLPLVILAINNQVCDDNSFTPYQMVFGQAARLPGTFFFNEDVDCDNPLQPIKEVQIFQENMRYFQRTSRQQEIPNPYVNCDLFTVPEVLLRDNGNLTPLSRLYAGPFRVIARNEKYFTISTDRGPHNVSIDRLKPFYRVCSDVDPD